MLAPAKVNLLLGVGPTRADGYHDVETVLAALDLADEVTLERASGLSLTRDPDPGFPPPADLTWRAAEALAAALGRTPDLAITLRKVIPVAAGLGGGSSDAAAVLAGACALWGVDPADPLVGDVARSLGADVSFFLTGGVALLEDRGDRLVRTLPAPELDIVLVNPGVEAPTFSVYRAFDADPAELPRTLASLETALAAGDRRDVAAALGNNLRTAATTVAPAVAHALRALETTPGVLGAQVSGSGATVFGIAEDTATAYAAAVSLRRPGWWTYATRSVAHGVRPT
jgi:4-diphosphocytidyl-2-C-methyl-D-erythritol kinase